MKNDNDNAVSDDGDDGNDDDGGDGDGDGDDDDADDEDDNDDNDDDDGDGGVDNYDIQDYDYDGDMTAAGENDISLHFDRFTRAVLFTIICDWFMVIYLCCHPCYQLSLIWWLHQIYDIIVTSRMAEC